MSHQQSDAIITKNAAGAATEAPASENIHQKQWQQSLKWCKVITLPLGVNALGVNVADANAFYVNELQSQLDKWHADATIFV